ncbi:MAG: DNA-processing protein DprA [Coriobacteriia bacterium]|nr:DNA-processing protein DprA [Coriobacteriia bacterium]
MDERFELKLHDPEYPDSLRDLEHPPQVLYGRGNLEILKAPSVSIVGARRATPYGIAAAKFCARIAVEHNLVITSGGAIGCDQAAGKEALLQGGKTIAVLACAADVVYPRGAQKFFDEIIHSGGALISEQTWGQRALPWMFPKRNRLIAALSQVLLVVEASLKSGTMSTANAAYNLGRSIFAVPGSIFSSNSQGCNQIISEGGQPIVDKDSLTIAFSREYNSLQLNQMKYAKGKPKTNRVLQALEAQAYSAQELSQSLGIPIEKILRLLSAYELEGSVVKLKSGLYSLSTSYYLKYHS